MDNNQISDAFYLLSKLMDIHGENAFKSKSYASSAFAIEKLTTPLVEIPLNEIASLKGIGASSAQKIIEFIQNGEIFSLSEIITKTPPGIIEMLKIKGIGPKKINTIWKEMEIETIGELLYACKENRLKLYKGFGEKTQQNVIESIEFYFKHKGSYLYAQAELIIHDVYSFLLTLFPNNRIEIIGEFKRQLEIIHQLEFMLDTPIQHIESTLVNYTDFSLKEKTNDRLIYSTNAGIDIHLFSASSTDFLKSYLQHTSSEECWQKILPQFENLHPSIITETTFFESIGLAPIPAFLRESSTIFEKVNKKLPDIINIKDIKGVIHCHSNWSDGNNTLEEMALAAINLGMEYLVISDHSKTAFYAQGLSIEKVLAQHQQIDEINKKLFPFKIFKSIESDILFDGNLDYPDDILHRFDLVIASIHSNLKMNEEKAMMRLIKAIENPYTTILGHMTGRLLLSRPGYPVDHKKIIDACAANHVVIELNANPSRLDIDWRQIEYALRKNVLISINPDSHHTDGLKDIQYGIWVAQKAMVTKESNLSSYALNDFEKYLASVRK